jgi:hypothetical protein
MKRTRSKKSRDTVPLSENTGGFSACYCVFSGVSVNTRSRSAQKKKGADYSANAGLMFL